ncbi:hypothetical protein HK104_002180 [Borealophlyctis nickersoniae]|nr:hypothetical protein HK104_002180 [Borealophlyctis nickersoniae]
MWVVPLHSVLGSGEQGKVFRPAPKGLRKVVLATNIAETGITIPDVVYVVDTVRAREISYDERRNITRLSEVLISKANCKQRRGRAGRLRPGVCYHLVPREVYEQLPAHRPPEMLRLPLEELSLRIRATASAHGHTGPIADLLAQAPDPPPVKHVDRAVGLLKQIQALDASENVTVLGTRLADLPLDARLGKMLLYAVALRCLDPVLTICAALSLGKSPFARPFGRESEADRARMVFRTADSDLLTYATAFHRWRDLHLRQVPIPTIREFFDHHFLSAPNLTLIEEARTQLLRGLASNDTIALPHPPTPGGGSKRTVSFTPIPPLYNTHADATSTVLTAISAGLYPNVLIRDATPPTEKAGGGLHAPGRSDTVRLHTSSVLHGETVKPGWFVCHGVRAAPPGGAQGKAKAIAWDVNRTTGIGLLGVAVGNLDVQHRLRTVSPTDAASNTANKLIARCSPRTAAAVAAFGRELHAVLERRMSTKDGAGGNADADEEVVRLFLKLVEDEAKNWVPNR